MCLAGIFGAKHVDKLPAVAIGKSILDSGDKNRPAPAPERTDKKVSKRGTRKGSGLSINTQGASQSQGLIVGNK